MEQFANQANVPIVTFEKGQRKDDVAVAFGKKFTAPEGVLFIGNAQEKTPVFRTERRRHKQTGATYPWLVFRLSWKWKERSAVKITERTREKIKKALRRRREDRHFAAAFTGEGADLQAL